jgi:hypothetical protein
MTPWSLNLKRQLGCEYINQHSPVVSEVFNCNSNVQIGDPPHVFYSTLYSSKNTQAEDADQAKRVTVAIIHRLVRYDRLVRAGILDRVPMGSPEGISRLLSVINTAISMDVVSTPMAHLLICQEGVRAGMLDRVPMGFPEGISHLLSAINTATSMDIVSAPMAHLLICQEGKHFQFSHDFAPLLINQIEDTLAGRDTNIRPLVNSSLRRQGCL